MTTTFRSAVDWWYYLVVATIPLVVFLAPYLEPSAEGIVVGVSCIIFRSTLD